VADRLNDPARLEAIAASGLIDAVEFEALNRVSRLAAHATGAPLALVNVVGAAQQATVAGVSRITASVRAAWRRWNTPSAGAW